MNAILLVLFLTPAVLVVSLLLAVLIGKAIHLGDTKR